MNLRRQMRVIQAVMWICCFITGVVVQAQHLVLGTVLITLPMLKLSLFASLMVPLVTGYMKGDRRLLRVWSFGSLAVTVSWAVSTIVGDLTFFQSTQFLLASYVFLFALPFAASADPAFTRLAERFCIYAFLPTACLGVVQYWMNDALLSTGGAEHGFEVMSWDFYGQVRAFSLFLSALDFGYYLSVMSAFFLLTFLRRRSTLCLLGLLLAGFAAWLTSTRLVFILCSMSVTTALLIAFRARTSIIAALPFIYLAVGISFLVQASGIGFSSSPDLGNLSSDDSLIERLFYWNNAWTVWKNGNEAIALFGTGESQSAANPMLIVDNVYLNALLQSGIVGLVGLMTVVIWLWFTLVSRLRESVSIFYCAIVSFYSTVLMGFLLNTNQFAYLLVVLPALPMAVAIRPVRDRPLPGAQWGHARIV